MNLKKLAARAGVAVVAAFAAIAVGGHEAPVLPTKHQEKKYRVDSFDSVLRKLHDAGAESGQERKSEHYYTHQPNNDVVKLVVHCDKAEIHELKERNGRFDLGEKIPLKDLQAGFGWLKRQGYTTLDVVQITYTDYGYKDGIVGLYIINDFLHSVILDYPQGRHETIEAEFDLQKAERIDIPYNKYLHRFSGLQTVKLE
jgi:hypothetical protein